jgi:hypothetical protein
MVVGFLAVFAGIWIATATISEKSATMCRLPVCNFHCSPKSSLARRSFAINYRSYAISSNMMKDNFSPLCSRR